MISCQVCGWENSGGATTCSDCGAALRGARARRQAPAPPPPEPAPTAPTAAPAPAPVATPSPTPTPDTDPATNPTPRPTPAAGPTATAQHPPAASGAAPAPRVEPPPALPAPLPGPPGNGNGTGSRGGRSPAASPAAGRTITVGTRFQPLPRAQLVQRVGGDGVARLPGAPGTPVHAIAAGMVVALPGPDAVVARGDDGLVYRYDGIASRVVGITPGHSVRAGDIIGELRTGVLEVRLTDPSGRRLDAVEALIGLADPNELGLAAPDHGIDPDALDRRLAPSDTDRDGVPP